MPNSSKALNSKAFSAESDTAVLVARGLLWRRGGHWCVLHHHPLRLGLHRGRSRALEGARRRPPAGRLHVRASRESEDCKEQQAQWMTDLHESLSCNWVEVPPFWTLSSRSSVLPTMSQASGSGVPSFY